MSPLQRARRDERGAGYLAAFIVLMSTLLVGGVAALADAGRIGAAQRRSSTIAFEAARAGAQEVRVGGGDGGIALDTSVARSRAASTANELAAASPARLEHVGVDGDEVVVVVNYPVRRWFPGLGTVVVREEGRARLAIGVVEEGG